MQRNKVNREENTEFFFFFRICSIFYVQRKSIWKEINIDKHKLVDSADAYKDGDWQEIWCTWQQGVSLLRELTQKDSHGLGLDMIFIQLFECFLSPRQGLGI